MSTRTMEGGSYMSRKLIGKLIRMAMLTAVPIALVGLLTASVAPASLIPRELAYEHARGSECDYARIMLDPASPLGLTLLSIFVAVPAGGIRSRAEEESNGTGRRGG